MILLALGFPVDAGWFVTRARAHQQPPAPVEQDGSSPIETPTDLPTEAVDPATPVATVTPLVIPGETPTASPTAPFPDPGPPADTPLPVVPTQPVETPTPTATVPPMIFLPPVDRPIEPPPTPAPPLLRVIDGVVAGALGATAWIWFTCGSLLFFIVAGMVAGMHFYRQERLRYDLFELTPPPAESPSSPRSSAGDEDDAWPASLP